MSIMFIVPLVLSLILVSFLTWLAVGNALLLVARRAGEQRVRMGMSVLAMLAIAVAASATWLFTKQAKQAAVQAAESIAAAPAANGRGGDLNLLVDRLEQRLRQEPGNAQGWALFARTQLELRRYPGAASAYAKAVSMLPGDIDLWVEFANAELMANGRKWNKAAADATEAALALNPDHHEALWLAGAHRFEMKDYAGAVRFWEKLTRIAPADSEYAHDLATTLVEARALRDGRDPAAAAGLGARPSPAQPSPTTNDKENIVRELRSALGATGESAPPSANSATAYLVSGEVRLLPELRGNIAPAAAIFVFARAAGADKSAMPLAAKRFRAADLPIQFNLSDNDAMSPQFKLSTAGQVIIVARLSNSGDARAQAGDLEGTSHAVPLGSGKISILINKPL